MEADTEKSEESPWGRRGRAFHGRRKVGAKLNSGAELTLVGVRESLKAVVVGM